MADKYIDALEVLAYGPFASEQIRTLVVGLDPDYDGVLTTMSARIDARVEAVRQSLQQAGALEKVTYTAAKGDEDPLELAKDVLRRLLNYVQSRRATEALASRILLGKNLSTVMRYRPTKLLGVLDNALEVIKDMAELPEYEERRQALESARDALKALDDEVRASRHDRRKMTPETAATRESFLRVYSASKHLVRSVLTLHGELGRMDEIFDDLAEVQRADKQP